MFIFVFREITHVCSIIVITKDIARMVYYNIDASNKSPQKLNL